MMTNRWVLPIALLCIIAGFGVGVFYPRENIERKDAIVTSTDVLPDEEPKLALAPVTHLTGEIIAVSGNTFTLKVSSFADPSLSTDFLERKVRVEPATKINALVQRDPATIQKEMSAFEKEMTVLNEMQQAKAAVGGAQISAPPIIFDRQEVSVGELSAGQSVSIVTKTDVRFDKEFTASSVEIVPQSPLRR